MDQTGTIATALTDEDVCAAVDVRAFAGEEDYEACVALQRRVWGEAYTCVPSALLKVAQRVGAVAAGAFDEAGAMLGFVFGLTGVEDGTLVHWSHMLAVQPAARDRGIGTLLKRHQVERVRALGAERIDWTFDPLVARNAHLNVNRFGVEVRAYAPDMYSGTGSDLHVFGTDRLIVSLPVSRRRAARPRPPEEAAAVAPFLNPRRGASALDARALSAPCVRIRIPPDITAIAAADPAAARAWRSATRAAFTRALADGFAIVQLRSETDGDCAYVLWREA
jgi:predicted GNAT superfamily acetyltransferase